MPRYEVPFGPAATAQLAHIIRSLKGDDLLVPVTVAVPSNYAGLSLRRRIGFGTYRLGNGNEEGLVNVRFMVFPRVAEFLGAPRLAAVARKPLTPVFQAEFLRAALMADPGPFAAVVSHPATVRSLVRTFRDLRRSPNDAVATLAAGGGRTAHVVKLYAAYRERCGGYYDEEDLAAAAAEEVVNGTAALRDIGHVVLYLPATLSPAEDRLADALEQQGLLTVIEGSVTGHAIDEPLLIDSDSAQRNPLHIVAAPDPEEELRTSLRMVLHQLEQGTPLHRMAVLYPTAQPYLLLAHAVFAGAEVLYNGPAADTLAQGMAGRFLLGALQLASQDFRRDALMDWLTSCPVRLNPDARTLVPSQRWEVLARDAGVVRGRLNWSLRLRALLESLADQRARAETEAGTARLAAIEANEAYIHTFQTFLDELFNNLLPPNEATWQAYAHWAQGLIERYLGRALDLDAWDEGQFRSYQAVIGAVGELEGLPTDVPVNEIDFLTALVQELEAPAGRKGRFGEGVFLGRYRDALGTDFDTVFLLGMNEGLVPGRGNDDPLLPDSERHAASDAIPLRASRLEDERRFYVAARASAPQQVLLYARADPRGQQGRLPSRWLLEAASACAGQTLFSADLERLPPQPWFTVVPSFEGGLSLQSLPVASEQDYDLRSLLSWRRAGGAGQHYRVTQSSRLRRGLSAQSERRSGRFTEWDGLVRPEIPILPPERQLSPTSLQTWAECPFHYFLGNVLRVEETIKPEDILTISPLERGSLIHHILERFLKAAPPRTSAGQPWEVAERQLLMTIAQELCNQAEQRGTTGKRLLWDMEREQILRDVAGFLDADEQLRRALGTVPLSSGAELWFGSGPTLAQVTLASGRTVTFRGSIDRLDVSPDGTRAVVLDYKTGSTYGYDKLVSSTISNGKKLQLPIYGLAAAARYPNASVEAYYWFVTEKQGYKLIGYPVDDSRLEPFKEAMGTIVEGIDGGLFPARPGKPVGDGDHENCRFCPFNRCCPTDRAAAWDRKRPDAGLQDYLGLLGES